MFFIKLHRINIYFVLIRVIQVLLMRWQHGSAGGITDTCKGQKLVYKCITWGRTKRSLGVIRSSQLDVSHFLDPTLCHFQRFVTGRILTNSPRGFHPINFSFGESQRVPLDIKNLLKWYVSVTACDCVMAWVGILTICCEKKMFFLGRTFSELTSNTYSKNLSEHVYGSARVLEIFITK